MTVTFRSPSAGSVVYIDEIAEELLRRMGRTGNVPGALRAEALPEAIAQLEENVRLESSTDVAAVDNDNDQLLDDDSTPVAIATRARPLLGLMKKAASSNSYVVWES